MEDDKGKKAAKERRKKEKWCDDGHSIVNMNVEGTSWYKDDHHKKRNYSDQQKELHEDEGILNRRDFRRVVFSATLISVAGAAVFMLVIAAFILFCTNVWFSH